MCLNAFLWLLLLYCYYDYHIANYALLFIRIDTLSVSAFLLFDAYLIRF
jgi:hypothetical protein